jgi:hypothetical protein
MTRVVTAACLVSLAMGCGPPTCHDIECFMNNLVITRDGKRVTLIEVPATSVPLPTSYTPMATTSAGFDLLIAPVSARNYGDPVEMMRAGMVAKPASAGVSAPSITNKLTPIMLPNPTSVAMLEIDFQDPNGETPAYWISPGTDGRPYPHCVWMTWEERDDIVKGKNTWAVEGIDYVDFAAEGFWNNPCGQLQPLPLPDFLNGDDDGGLASGDPAVDEIDPPPAPDDGDNGGGGNGGGGSGGSGGGGGGDEVWTIYRPDGAAANVTITSDGTIMSSGDPQWMGYDNSGECSFDTPITGTFDGTSFNFSVSGSGCGSFSVTGTATGMANDVFGAATSATGNMTLTANSPLGPVTNQGTFTAERTQ